MQDERYPNAAASIRDGWGVLSRHEYDVLGEIGDVIRSIASRLPAGFASGYLAEVANDVQAGTESVLAALLADGLVSETGRQA